MRISCSISNCPYSCFYGLCAERHDEDPAHARPRAADQQVFQHPDHNVQRRNNSDRNIINGPPVPPPGYELERATVSLPEPNPEMGTNTLTVPAFRWVFGCSAVSGAMIAGYYDRNGFPNMYTGPTNGGVMPLIEDPSWGTWTDIAGATYPNNPLIASHNGLDGRSTRGSIDDYWVQYGVRLMIPISQGSWTQHTWGDAIGDYMKTSQSAYGNTDGATSFYSFNSAARLPAAIW